MSPVRRIGDVIFSHRKAIIFLTVALCLAGAHSARTLPTSVFPQTNFPRVVILIDNGVMPVDEMMATVTRPVEEAMRNIQGVQTIRSATSRGSAEVNVFFDWSTDMIQSELYVLGRLSQIRSGLPPQASFAVHRLTFKAFPIFGVSLTSDRRGVTELWTRARYELSPRLLALEEVARINVVGGSRPEFHVVVDPGELAARHLTLDDISQAIGNANVVVSAGMREEDRQLYLTTVDNRFRNKEEIENAVVAWVSGSAVRIRDVGSVRPGSEPRYNVVTADGRDAVLLNVYGQPGSDTLGIAESLRGELKKFKEELPPDMRLAFFYDQSQFVEEGVASVWESIFAGLALAALVLFGFLRRIGPTIVATAVIPVTVLLTILGLRAAGMSFNLMTLGGIAAAIGMVIDDAIVIVEAIHSWVSSGLEAAQAATRAIQEVGLPLVGSTLTPVVVFIPLAFLDGVPGVFFRALALTMVFALLGSLVLALTWTPAIASLLMRPPRIPRPEEIETGAQEALRAKAALEAHRVLLNAAKALLAKNELAAVKVKELAANVAVAEAESKQARARLDLLRAGTRTESIHEAEARRDRALADLASADLRVGYHSITSPLAGTVLSVGVRRGTEVARGAILAEVADLSEVLAEVRVPGRAYTRLTMGAPATASVIGRRDRAVTGRLVRTAGSADPANGEMIVWVAVPNEDQLLRPGLTCHISLALDEIADCVVVPTEAVADRFGKPVISVLRDGSAHEVPVTLGLRVGGDTQILKGIDAGETVITAGGYGLPDGCPVEVLH